MKIEGFQRYLVEHGCKRFAGLIEKKTPAPKEDYDSYYVSTYGPLDYYFTYNDKVILYWGLNVVGRSPYYWQPRSFDEFIVSDDWEAEFKRLIKSV